MSRLRARCPEIEQAIFARIRQLAETVGNDDPVYVAGLQKTVGAVINYGFECILRGSEPVVAVPIEAASQARRAAREGVRLDTVLRRYAAGNMLLEEFIVAEGDEVSGHVLSQILGDLGPQLDRLMEFVAVEYRDELERAMCSSAKKRADRVLELLDGSNLVGTADLDYDFGIWHVGMIFIGSDIDLTIRVLAEKLGCRSLCVAREHDVSWGWLGGRQRQGYADLERFLVEGMPAETSVAVGEPCKGMEGWRLTHREAQVALQVALRRPKRITRGRDVILLAGILRDEMLVRSLLDTYLAPLQESGSLGRVLLETLRAYFSAGGNAAAAAVCLGVTRHTVQRRIRTVESKVGQPLHTCAAQLRVALQVDELQLEHPQN